MKLKTLPELKQDARLARKLISNRSNYSRWRRTPEGELNARRLADLRNLHQGRRAVIMGNGPSLTKSDLHLLADEVTIVSNANYLMWDQLSYIPKFLLVEDRLVAEDRADELRALSGLTRIFPFDLKALLGPPASDQLYVNFQRQYPGGPKFSFEFDRVAFWGGTVSFLNLQLAWYLGCNPIIMVGFDHSYKVEGETISNNVIVSERKDVNHFHPDYFGPGYRWHDPNVERMEKAYVCARTALGGKGVRVYNSTVGGKLEVFERAELKELL